MSGILWILLVIAAGYILLLLTMYLFQNNLIYYPDKEVSYTPSSVGLDYEEVWLTTNDGVRIHGWYVPTDQARGTILFSHGNAGNISGRMETLRIFHQLNMNVLMYDYRGYGKSEGKTNEQGTYSDALAVWEYLINEQQKSPDTIVIMGRSLGGGVSAWLATQTNPAALILESTFTSATDLAQELYPFVPARWLMEIEYPTRQYIKNLGVPKLILHSRDDELIPFHHGEELYTSTIEPKEFFEMQGNHGGGHIITGSEYTDALDRFLNTIFTIKDREEK